LKNSISAVVYLDFSCRTLRLLFFCFLVTLNPLFASESKESTARSEFSLVPTPPKSDDDPEVSYTHMGNPDILNALKKGCKRIAFSLCEGDLQYKKVMSTTSKKLKHSFFRGEEIKVKVKEKTTFCFSCPLCKHEIGQPENRALTNLIPGWYFSKILAHLINMHQWKLTELTVPDGVVTCNERYYNAFDFKLIQAEIPDAPQCQED
jgi:hypothetical protein